MDSTGKMGNEYANIFLQTFFYRFCPQDPYGYTYIQKIILQPLLLEIQWSFNDVISNYFSFKPKKTAWS